MLNVSWAKKRAEFVFVFAIRGRERRGRREERERDRQTMKIRNDGMRRNVRGMLREQEKKGRSEKGEQVQGKRRERGWVFWAV